MTRPKQGKDQDKPQGPPPGQQKAIPIGTHITRHSKGTTAEKDEAGNLHINFIVQAEGELQLHTMIVEEQGKKNIMDAATGGLEVAHAGQMPPQQKS